MTKRKCYLCGAKGEAVSLHSFPKNVEERKVWKQICGLLESDDVSACLICSNHFIPDDYPEPNAKAMGRSLRLKPKRFPSKKVPFPIQDAKCGSEMVIVSEKQPEPSTSTMFVPSIQPGATPCSAVQPSSSTVYTPSCEPNINLSASIAQDSPKSSFAANTETDETEFHTPTKKRKFFEPRFVSEIRSPDLGTPRKAKRAFNLTKDKLMKEKKKVRALAQKNRRLISKVATLRDMVDHLKKRNSLSEDAADTILDIVPVGVQDIIKRRLKNKKKEKYSPELRTFALSLQFYSSKAYEYVRKTWNNMLPHPSTIRAWYSKVGGDPGFSSEALQAIAEQEKSKHVILNIVIDEISIREQMVFENGRFYGGVDLGTQGENTSDNLPAARLALVFMAVALNGSWKIPVGYMLIKSLTGSERANLLTKCLELVHETGAEVSSITFDGAASNISMCTNLGANFQYGESSFRPYFLHPVTKQKVFVFFDACHMIKLVRNCLGDKGVIVDEKKQKILWTHIQELNEAQAKERLHLGCKLTKKHIKYDSNRMNVKLAAQTLSQSVSSALIYLKETKYCPMVFENCEGTSNFCEIFNNIFDILNTKSKFGKLVLNSESYDVIKTTCERHIQYIFNLTEPSGKRMIHTCRKVGFLGMIINLINITELYNQFKDKVDYVLSFKVSQDHLETFFSAIRSRGGWNNNPTCKQFQTAFKRLLVKNEIKLFSNSNCLPDGLDILHVSSKKENFKNPVAGDDAVEVDSADHDYVNTMWQLNTYVEDVVKYIGGFIVKKIEKMKICRTCFSYLHTHERNCLLIAIKNRANFLFPSTEVIFICKAAEKILRQNEKKMFNNNTLKYLISKTFQEVAKDVFNTEDFVYHLKDQDPLDNHKSQIIKIILEIFFKIRLFHETKRFSEKDDYIRSKYNRLVLFKNQ